MIERSLVLDVDETGNVMDQCNDQSSFFDKETEKVALVQSSDLSTKQQTPLYLYFLTVFAAIGGFLFGYDTGVISGAMILIKEEFHLSFFWQELIVSATIGTAIPGALLGGFVNQRLGRKPMLIASAMVFMVGAVIMAAAHSREVILIGRLTVGFGIGNESNIEVLCQTRVFCGGSRLPAKEGARLTINVEFCEDNSGTSKKMRYFRKNKVGARAPGPLPWIRHCLTHL